jgi:hypothetical protein
MPNPTPGRPTITRDRQLRRLYWIWNSMVRRCHDPRTKSYTRYGGTGITVCDQWRADFWSFHDDMGGRPEGAMIDRRDNELGYSPDNCRWVNAQQSASNRRYCIIIDGLTLKEYMRRLGDVSRYRMVTKRIRKGMSLQDALRRPARTWPGKVQP